MNENLQPLVRFLRSRVGKRWIAVHSEIAARISSSSAVQKHVLDHLPDYVAKDVRMIGKVAMSLGHRGFVRLTSTGMHLRFYIHPVSRLLCLAPVVRRKRRVKSVTDEGRVVLSSDRELRCLDGVWYEIEVASIPPEAFARARCFDVAERTRLEGAVFEVGARRHPLWSTGRYAAKKHQMKSREVARHGLRGRP